MTTQNDWRALCIDLADSAREGHVYGIEDALAAIDAALAQPEPQGASRDDLRHFFYLHCDSSDDCAHWLECEPFVDAALGVLASWGRPTIKPEPQGPTDEEIGEWQFHCAYLTRPRACGGAGTGDHYWAFDVESDHVAGIVRAAFAHWGRPAIKPVPVAERPWERKGWCDAEGRCWWGDPEGMPSWWYCYEEDICDATHCLPHWALPVPTP